MRSVKVTHLLILISFVLVVFIFIASVLGITYQEVYAKETSNWAMQAKGQDMGNLVALIPFSISVYLLKRRSLKGFLLYVGCLLYFIYAYVVYSFFIHFNFLFLIYVSILGTSSYLLIYLLITQDYVYLKNKLTITKQKMSSIVLIATGVLFEFLWLSEIIPALVLQSIPQSAQIAGLWINPIHVIDLALVLPGMIVTGVLLLKRNFFGYLFAVPWLAFSTFMGISIVITLFMELQNGKSEAIAPMVMVSIIVILSSFFFYQFIVSIKSR